MSDPRITVLIASVCATLQTAEELGMFSRLWEDEKKRNVISGAIAASLGVPTDKVVTYCTEYKDDLAPFVESILKIYETTMLEREVAR